MERATRTGVLSRPSRFGSSPISSSSRRTSSSNSLLSCVLDIVVFSLPQDEALERARLHPRCKDSPERRDDVLRSRDDSLHERNVEIEVLVVHHVDDLALDDLLELGEVADVASLLIDLTLDRNVERIIVAVPVRIVALSEQTRVLGLRQFGVMNAVGGVEPQTAGDCYARHV